MYYRHICFLWDKAALAWAMLCLVLCVLNPSLFPIPSSFLILWIPGLLANYASIWLIARRDPRQVQDVYLYRAGCIVGAVGWLVYVPLASLVVAPLLRLNSAYNLLVELPLLLVYLVVGECWFYCIHRFLHSKKRLFRLFHEHHHRITDPHVVNASYQHPVELVVITMGTAWVGPLLLPGHWTTVVLFSATIMILGNIGHSGCRSMHDSHHRLVRGNFGFVFMDAALKTTLRASHKAPSQPSLKTKAHSQPNSRL